MDSFVVTLGNFFALDSVLIFGFWLFELSWWTNALSVAIGLGLVIFVHELGHFAVAKFCGVRCDKFYLGFDIGGWKIWKFKAGETEYGIGILPLGGYVKMLGQEDNPGRLKEEIQRAKSGQAPLDAREGEEAAPLSEEQVKELESALYDPRSYLAQSVPKRMAIISAGVIMNVIFAFCAATLAYSIGVQHPVCGVGAIQPGDAAWAAGLQPGDMILKIDNQPTKLFRDLQSKVVFNESMEDGIPFLIQRPGIKEPISLIVHPNLKRQIPSIGIQNPFKTSLILEEDEPPAFPATAATKAEPAFASGDNIIEVNGKKIDNAAQLYRVLALERDKPLDLKVERLVVSGQAESQNSETESSRTEVIDVTVPTEPLLGVGFVMEMGPIIAVQKESPAEKAGLKPNDLIKQIDGEVSGDPMTLEYRLSKKVGQTITLTIDRDGQQLDIPVTVGEDNSWDSPVFDDSPITVPELGIAIQVNPVVVGITPDSPAAKAGVKPDQRIKSVTLILPKKEAIAGYLTEKQLKEYKPTDLEMIFESRMMREAVSWPKCFALMQNSLPGIKLKVVFEGGNEVTLMPAPLPGRFNPDRGMVFEPITIKYKPESFGEAIRLGVDETLRQMTLIFRFLDRLFSGGLSPTALAGPGSIVTMASRSASEGFTTYLLFLTLLSANLAVINFLPIPVLDGGHMVFLTYELIRRKPANEQVQIALSYLGLLLILTLMIWVLGLDFIRYCSGFFS